MSAATVATHFIAMMVGATLGIVALALCQAAGDGL